MGLTLEKIDPLSASKAMPLPSGIRLAQTFGTVDALVIQVLHEETKKEPHPEGGFIWCRISYLHIAKQLDLSEKTIRRAVARLKKAGVVMVIVSSVYNNLPYDGTKSYRLIYASIAKQTASVLN